MLTLLGYEDHYRSINVPDYFNHVRYGLYYYDLVKENAAKYDLDPLLVLSVMRQESLFEGFIHSSAGARGLMQIMPATGESIAQQMGLAEYFNIDQLDQPNVSLALGTHYINSNMNYLNKDMFAVLAAYNAGPGNASIWQSLAGGDQDLELEVIRFGEPREYIKSIFETYFMYQKLYSIRN
jgi:soluble lytic murein transglycosylase